MSLAEIDKAALLASVRDRLRADLEAILLAQKSTQDGVTHEDNRAEGDKDMRSTEASYVARGQAMRASELFLELQRVETVVSRSFAGAPLGWGALFSLTDGEGKTSHHLLMPGGAGVRLSINSKSGPLTITIVSARSPLGQELVGAVSGDLISVEQADSVRSWTLSDAV